MLGLNHLDSRPLLYAPATAKFQSVKSRDNFFHTLFSINITLAQSHNNDLHQKK